MSDAQCARDGGKNVKVTGSTVLIQTIPILLVLLNIIIGIFYIFDNSISDSNMDKR